MATTPSTLQNSLLSQEELTKQIFTKGATVYLCDTCSRKIRVQTNKLSFDVVQRCIITKNCLGKLHKVILNKDANSTPSIPPAVPGVLDWSQRRVFYLHTQPIESKIWTVVHNLENKPSIQVFVTKVVDSAEVLVEIVPLKITTIDLNTTEIEFDQAYKGQAQCLATASANITNPSVGTPTVVTQETMQVTNGAELTLATLNAAPTISFVTTFRSSAAPGGSIDINYVNVDNHAAVLSPWTGTNIVYIGGKSYTVRSYNIKSHALAPSAFSANLIASGSQMFFSGFSTLPGQNLILLGTSPFGTVDRVLDRYIDIALISTAQPQLAFAEGEVFATPDVIKNTYPLIYIVD